ncbi:hypothetical protein HK100_009106 [Physocladia obscura]|uniref:Uncharacterized protein n=1 Tax=Physocladia obscura TaxID=109957 RepID=A0AAD5X9V0_9FUNG|nr:hypothetical protein HK100_009106 [Physocladia obscura]
MFAKTPNSSSSNAQNTAAAAAAAAPKGEKVADLAPYTALLSRSLPVFISLIDSWTAVLSAAPAAAATASDNAEALQDVSVVVKFFDAVVLAFLVRDVERLTRVFLKGISAAAIES